MFDTIHHSDKKYQFKAFDCMDDDYHVIGGRLIKMIWSRDGWKKKKAEAPKQVDMAFHGMIYATETGTGRDVVFKFTDGALVDFREASE